MQNKIIIFSFFVFSILKALDVSAINSTQKWFMLQDAPVQISTTDYSGYPICKVAADLPFPLPAIAQIIENTEDYPDIFNRVTQARELENDVIHITLDMPFPFESRDYVVKYRKQKNEKEWTFTFSAVEHTGAPVEKNVVRLIHAAGEWKLTKLEEQKTRVTYIWNGQLLGDFPSWGLNTAWKEQGNEIIEWLSDALQNNN